VVVVGSINVDYVMRVPRRPAPGETVSGAVLEIHSGGKGANQAVAVARCGAAVEMVGRVGHDAAGQGRIADLAGEGVSTAHVWPTESLATGAAFISVTPDGENSIISAPGANGALSIEDVDRAAPVISRAGVLVAQLEVPLVAVARAAEVAGHGPLIVLNCAPYRPVPAGLLERVDVLVANETEAAGLTGQPVEGIEGARRAGRSILALGPRAVVVTLGPLGAVVVAADKQDHIAAPEANAVDTTGAGDAFVGAVAAHLAAGDQLSSAVRYGTVAGTATTEQRGASPVVPVSARISL
jgi:ribokinase